MFAVMKETDYALKPKFLANFWNDWKQLLGSNHEIHNLEGCDFTPIYEWHLAEKEKKQKLTAEVTPIAWSHNEAMVAHEFVRTF